MQSVGRDRWGRIRTWRQLESGRAGEVTTLYVVLRVAHARLGQAREDRIQDSSCDRGQLGGQGGHPIHALLAEGDAATPLPVGVIGETPIGIEVTEEPVTDLGQVVGGGGGGEVGQLEASA